MSSTARPIIVLGAARSGTKFLRDVLAASPSAAAVPYDMNFVWRTGNEAAADDALDPAQCPERTAVLIRRRLRAAARPRNGARRLVEKTVSNTVRVPFVARVFPDADFVHIVRDGREVVESSLRQWRAPTEWRYLLRKARAFPLGNYRYALWYAGNLLRGRGARRAVWGVRYPGIDADLARLSLPEVCARQWVESVERAAAAGAALPRFRQIRYEDLVAGPAALEQLLDWLQLDGREAVMKRYAATIARAGVQAWDRGLVPAEARAALDILSPSLQKFGYR